ncbi:MAG: ribose-5-phosphate isomerase RpiA [Mangrovibacterium sp.]
MNPKQLIGEKAAEYVRNGMIVGLGTGSTAYWAVRRIGELVRGGLRIKGVPTSKSTEQLARAEGIPLTSIEELKHIDLTIDGADEFDPDKNVIKGGGGALLREKIVASLSREYIIIADAAKRVDVLGAFPMPVEVTPFAWQVSARQLEKLGCHIRIRKNGNELFVTDNNNYILDCHFERIDRAGELADQINRVPGVVENGLFLNMVNCIITTSKSGEIIILD